MLQAYNELIETHARNMHVIELNDARESLACFLVSCVNDSLVDFHISIQNKKDNGMKYMPVLSFGYNPLNIVPATSIIMIKINAEPILDISMLQNNQCLNTFLIFITHVQVFTSLDAGFFQENRFRCLPRFSSAPWCLKSRRSCRSRCSRTRS